MQSLIFNLLILFLSYNLVTCIIFGYDKWLAKNQKRRIPERTLLVMGCLFGAVGATCGMYLFRHKTQKKKFSVTLPVLLFFQIMLLLIII